MAYNKMQALTDNIEAIALSVVMLQGPDAVKARGLNNEQCIEALKKYSGFGGLKEVLYLDLFLDTETNKAEIESHKKDLNGMESELEHLADVLKQTSSQIGVPLDVLVDSIKASVLTAFYTPKEVVNAVADAVKNTFDVFGIKGATFLEPSAGTGGFLPVATAGMKKVAFEKDVVSALVAQALNPDVDVLNDPFEHIDIIEDLPEKFDVVSSNIPFGNIPVADLRFAKIDDDHRLATQKLHTYFFMKAMERLENGGILAFITSRGVADSRENQFLRDWMVRNGNLLSAVRLPDNLFMAGSGIEVGSDLIIFQRDIHKSWQTVAEQQFSETFCKVINGEECQWVNRYLCQPRQAIYSTMKVAKNQYGEMKPTYKWNGSMLQLHIELKKRLINDMTRNFRHSAWLFGHDTLRQAIDAMQARNAGKSPAIAKAQQAKAKLTEQREKIKPYIKLMMEFYNQLMCNERRDHRPDNTTRLHLNDAYDALVENCGTLHANAKACENHIAEWPLVLSLENKNPDGTFTKADVFTQPVAYRIVKPGEKIEPLEALAMSLNERGRVDMEYIGKLTQLLDEEYYDALKGEIFLVPDENGELEWQYKSKTINGDVITKRKACEQYDEEHKDLLPLHQRALTDTIASLKEATPTPVPYDDIEIQLGARWLPAHYFARFAKQQFCLRNEPKVEFMASTDDFHVDGMSAWGSETAREYEYGYERKIQEIFRYALYNNCPQFQKTEHGVKYKDTEAIRAVQKIIERMRREFGVWIKSGAISPDERKEIETLYNETYNCCVRNKFDGSLLTLPGLDFSQLGFNSLYPSQKDCIWMVMQNNGGVGYHSVGAGKTLIMICASYEMHRLGMCKKPLIIGMKANIVQIADTYRKAYPNARILFPTKKDFEPQNRRELFSKIANNDWDCVILSHEQFALIPQAEEVEMKMVREELKDLEEVIAYMENESLDKQERRRKSIIEKSIETLKAKLYELQQRIDERDDKTTLNFRQMSFDHIFVDEYHNFKNLRFNTRHQRVAGLGNSTGSQKAWKLLCAIRDIQERNGGKDMGASLFSGTVISNALTELYVLFKYLRPNELKRQSLRCFDAWAGNFTDKKVDYDLTITGDIQAKERFRSYINIPELSMFLAEITDYRTAEMINLDRPKANTIFDNAEPTAEQEVMLKRLIDFAQSGNYAVLGIGEHKPSSKKKKEGNGKGDATMLLATDIARKVSLDPRIISTDLFHDDATNKSSRCARRIADYYERFNEQKGTQFVFCDLSAPTEDNIKEGKWNIYEDIRNKLVADYGIPANEIAFIHEANTDAKREKMFEDMNAGRIRVLFGSTQKLGTGVNAQERAVAVHHLDIPWKPSDLEQRDGRAVRKGNMVKVWGNNQVDVIVYGTNRTLDAYKFQLLRTKQLFISQIGNHNIGTRKIDEDQMDEDSGMNFAEYVALLSGNDDLLKKAKLDNKIGALEADLASHQRACNQAKVQLEASKQSLDNLKKTFNIISNDLNDFEDLLAKGGKTVSIIGAEDATPEAQVKALHKWRSDHNHVDGVEVGKYGPLTIKMYTHVDEKGVYQYQEFCIVCPFNKMRYRCNERGTLPATNEATLSYFDGLTDYMRKLIDNNTAAQNIRKEEIERYTFEANREWDGQDELNALLAERDALTEKVNKEIDARTMAQQDNVMAIGHDELATAED